jgi:hypothetical protein
MDHQDLTPHQIPRMKINPEGFAAFTLGVFLLPGFILDFILDFCVFRGGQFQGLFSKSAYFQGF